MVLYNVVVALIFSILLYAIITGVILKQEISHYINKILAVLVIYTLLCFNFAINNCLTIDKAYRYIVNNIDDYNIYLFKKANLEYDSNYKRLNWGIDNFLIDRLNETDFYKDEKILKLVNRDD